MDGFQLVSGNMVERKNHDQRYVWIALMTKNLHDLLAQQEAMRQANASTTGIEAMMARISAEVTADAAEKMADFAIPYRKDIKIFPPDIVLGAAKKHRTALESLSKTPEQEKAIRDLDAFINETQVVI